MDNLLYIHKGIIFTRILPQFSLNPLPSQVFRNKRNINVLNIQEHLFVYLIRYCVELLFIVSELE